MYDDKRKQVTVERGEGLIVAQDYLKQRINKEEFRICEKCPQPQSAGESARYKVSCKKHQSQDKV